MRSISERRRLVEQEGHRHSVKRGFRWKLHFENLPILSRVLEYFLAMSLMRRLGEMNAANLEVEEVEIEFGGLPKGFDNTRILFITDLHIEGMEGLGERIIAAAKAIEYDYCVLGGDYSFSERSHEGAYSQMRELVRRLRERSRVFAVLGNHDRYSMAEVLSECGAEMLINESICLERDGERIYLSGVDDCHYYGADDIESAGAAILDGEFKVMVSHSPECYKKAERSGYSLLLTGHTHGGQVCLPGGVAVVTSATVPRRMVKGKWQYRGMKGYTSRGAGASGVGVRFFCRPEMTVIMLRRDE
jgi:predicted MPP superfamily phosphohydrolase